MNDWLKWTTALFLMACPATMAGPLQGIHAGRYVAPDGTIKKDVIVDVRDGKIVRVRSAEQGVSGPNIVSHPEAVLSPGLIDLGTQLGAFGKAIEEVEAIDPAASAIDSVDIDHPDFARALRAGITATMIIPSPNNLVAGAATTIKTAMVANEVVVMGDDGPLVFALGTSVWSFDRAPTSRIGSISMLRTAIEEAGAGSGHERIRNFIDGRLSAVIQCEQAMDVSAALRTLGGGRRELAVMYTGAEEDLADELAGYSATMIVGPYLPGMPPYSLAGAGELARAGVPVAFRSGAPQGAADGMRRSAALAVKYGMDAAAARKAITRLPAALAGVADRTGSIHQGMDADLVIFSDDPLRLDSRVLEVYVGGVRMYDASLSAFTGETP